MRHPTDPRKHGLKRPEKTITKTEEIISPEQDELLEAIVNRWKTIKKFHKKNGHNIISDPIIIGYSHIKYSYEFRNNDFDDQQAAYNAAVAKYEAELIEFNRQEEENKKLDSERSSDEIDKKIRRTEQRLANLKAITAGEQRPFPGVF